MSKPPVVSDTRIDGFAIASLALSIMSVALGPFGFIPGIICGHLGLRRISRDSLKTGRGLAIAGLIIGYLALVAFVILVYRYFDAMNPHNIPDFQ